MSNLSENQLPMSGSMIEEFGVESGFEMLHCRNSRIFFPKGCEGLNPGPGPRRTSTAHKAKIFNTFCPSKKSPKIAIPQISWFLFGARFAPYPCGRLPTWRLTGGTARRPGPQGPRRGSPSPIPSPPSAGRDRRAKRERIVCSFLFTSYTLFLSLWWWNELLLSANYNRMS